MTLAVWKLRDTFEGSRISRPMAAQNERNSLIYALCDVVRMRVLGFRTASTHCGQNAPLKW